ncbi:MAG: NAD-glutamate dehydrogenase [Azospirillaceae bacterium]|nr:NAD-glutamate dehydrogenase [Azospirillaceae bacterium]
MAFKSEHQKDDLIDQIIIQVQQRLGRDGDRERLIAAERFVRHFYANVPPEDMARTNAEQLYGAALAIWQFAAQRNRETPLVRIYNPQLEHHGWQSGHTVVEIVNDDMPFLVDSVTAALGGHDLGVHLVIHPVVRVRRDAEGRLLEVADPVTGDSIPESFLHIEVDRQTQPEILAAIGEDLIRVLREVRSAIDDWGAMRSQAAASFQGLAAAQSADVAEAVEFQHWLDDDNFTFLGYRAYRFVNVAKSPLAAADLDEQITLEVIAGSGLGVLRDDAVLVFEGLRNFSSLPPDVRNFLREPRLVMLTKTNRHSRVHRPVPMDAIFVKVFDPSGIVIGEQLFVGLLTATAYARSAREIPFLRQKVARILDRAGFDPHSHDGKALIHILETLPRDELFQITDDELYELSLGVLHLQERQRIALFIRRDPFERFVSCFVYIPRDRYDTLLRHRFQKIIETSFNGACDNFYIQVASSVLARVHYVLRTTPGQVPEVNLAELELRLVEAARSWADRLGAALIDAWGEEQGLRLAKRYAEAFPSNYAESFGVQAAVFDIERVEEVLASSRLGVNLYRPLEAGPTELHFKIYRRGTPVSLSDILPMLEHMGVKVITEVPFELRVTGPAETIWLHEFTLRVETGTAGEPLDLVRLRDKFHDAFLRVWEGRSEDDGFNRLVLRAAMSSREVSVLRAYAKYLRQARFPFSQDYIEDALALHAGIARSMLALFLTRHDPALPLADADAMAASLQGEIERDLDQVTNLEEDQILRRLLNLVLCTLRTNYFQQDADHQPKAYLSLKLDSRRIDDLPLPRPMVEIWVCSPRMEGVHLRGGKVARGGIRWSDRREDFRTEILGLMKAQMVKNTVIVPVGSKGGFVAKRLPGAEAGRTALMAEVIDCYKILMRGLLDLTDNYRIEQGTGEPVTTVVPPPAVVRHDGDDPYLVVAADKGTATFSDIANGVARDYGFWLDDAFASGGSAGYDHKKMGITARGAWEGVKRHFREIGRDIQREPFRVVGVGDMAGDVFGNGMLLSEQIRLIGAFNHQHIFCDPEPDAVAGFAERRRLFELGRGWGDYDPAALSPGGGIFDRHAKSIALSPQIRQCLGLSDDRVTPSELIRALLSVETDLLWFGGIGTFIKAGSESHADVGDKSNDALRIDAERVRARVIGEGANLGVTQRGRIVFARRGGHINTDAIDNAAGVNTSDHEVNIKVLLGDVIDRGDMTVKQRDQLLAEMTDDVAALVLSDNYLQTQALSVVQAQGGEALELQMRLMRALERAGHLNRAIEFLPDDEALAALAAKNQGLTRPELAVLLAYSKITLNEALLRSDVPDDPRMVEDLIHYFPKRLRRRFEAAIERHRLRREIIATHVTNSMVNRVGPTFVQAIADRTGQAPDAISRAYAIAREAFSLRPLWTAIESLDSPASCSVQIAMIIETQSLLDRVVTWFLTNAARPLDMTREVETYRPGIQALADDLAAVLDRDQHRHLDGRTQGLIAQGVPDALARQVAGLPVLVSALDICRIAGSRARPVPAVARIYFSLGHLFGIEWLRDQARKIKTEDHWQKLAVAATIDDLFAHQSQLASHVLQTAPEDGVDPTEAWIATRPGPVERTRQLLTELRAASRVDLAMLAVANRQLRALIG